MEGLQGRLLRGTQHEPWSISGGGDLGHGGLWGDRAAPPLPLERFLGLRRVALPCAKLLETLACFQCPVQDDSNTWLLEIKSGKLGTFVR